MHIFFRLLYFLQVVKNIKNRQIEVSDQDFYAHAQNLSFKRILRVFEMINFNAETYYHM